MAEPFLAEIRIMSFAFAPKGWALCDGQVLPINQNQALFALLGTTYGGDERVTFALPDLRARTPVHVGNGHALGQKAGEAAHTLSLAELPSHTHVARAVTDKAATPAPNGNMLAATKGLSAYAAPANLTALAPSSIANTGGGQPHSNVQPFLTLNFCIALQGIFPSRT
jgi:microcystin-dependent protein